MSSVFDTGNNFYGMSAVDLIQKLDRDYPARCIGPDETLDHARYYAGKRDLVDALLAKLNREDK